MTDEDMQNFQSMTTLPVDPEIATAIETSDQHMLRYGPEDAPASRRMSVFHDPNCEACQRFQSETLVLSEDGWRISVYPVANTSEESAGYGAVALALRDISPDAVETLYAAMPETADFETAMGLAIEAGVSTNDVLKAIATTGAYEAVEDNTRTLAELGAEGTPAWIVGTSLYTGFLSAPAVINVTSGGNAADNAPSPAGTPPAALMEQ
jgi:protein-disulfide isomerase